MKQADSIGIEVEPEIQQKIDTLISKHNLIEIHDLEDLQLNLIKSRKLSKNQSMVKSILGTYDDRYLAVAPVENQLSFIVFQKNQAVVQTTHKLGTIARQVVS